MSNLAIIPARGGSKRIPRKNIKDFLGKPIISYSIKTALESGLFEEVMVSTDDKEISQVAKSFGANIPFLRSEKNANDHTKLIDVIKEVVTSFKERGQSFKYICCILPTAPFTTIEHLQEGYNLIRKQECDSVLTVCKYPSSIYRSLKIEKTFIQPIFEEYLGERSQDLPEAYFDAGQFYWATENKLLSSRKITSGNAMPIVLPLEAVEDIDTPEDWSRAEKKFTLNNMVHED